MLIADCFFNGDRDRHFFLISRRLLSHFQRVWFGWCFRCCYLTKKSKQATKQPTNRRWRASMRVGHIGRTGVRFVPTRVVRFLQPPNTRERSSPNDHGGAPGHPLRVRETTSLVSIGATRSLSFVCLFVCPSLLTRCC